MICAKTAESIDLPFGLWTGMEGSTISVYSPGGANMRSSEETLAQPGEYDSTIRLRRRCGLMSNYFDRSLLLLLLLPNFGSVLIDADVFLSC